MLASAFAKRFGIVPVLERVPLCAISLVRHHGGLVAILKAYLDDAGKANDPNTRAVAIAGYVAPEEAWRDFEEAWGAVLDKYAVGYFHWNEFAHSVGAFAGWKGDEPRRVSFISELANAATNCGEIAGVAAAVYVEDLQRFEQTHKIALDDYSFCLSCCLMELHDLYPGATIDCILDKIDRPHPRIARALGYLSADPMYSACKKHIGLSPLIENLSSKTILPLQLADFLASEVKKSNEGLAYRRHNESARNLAELGVRALGLKTPSHWSGERASLAELLRVAPVQKSRLWDYDEIVRLDDAREHRWAE